MEQDMVSRIICDSLNLRIYTAATYKCATEITRIHETTPNASMALARTISATTLLAATMKPGSNQSVAVKFSGNGPLKEVYAQADAFGNIRAYASRPRMDEEEDIQSLNFSRAIGAGFLTVIRDSGVRDPYRTVLPLQYGDIAADITYYLAASEQIPSALILGLELDKNGRIETSGGILFQTFPDTKDDVIQRLDETIHNMPYSLGREMKEGKDIVSIVSGLLGNEPLTIMESTPLRVNCRCTKDLLHAVLESVDLDELKAMRDEDGRAEITCTFCRTVYNISVDELDIIIRKRENN